MISLPPPAVRDITPAQLRAARSLLGWSREEAATRCKVGVNTIARFEKEGQVPGLRILADMVQVFERSGVEFVRDETGEGVFRRHPEAPAG